MVIDRCVGYLPLSPISLSFSLLLSSVSSLFHFCPVDLWLLYRLDLDLINRMVRQGIRRLSLKAFGGSPTFSLMEHCSWQWLPHLVALAPCPVPHAPAFTGPSYHHCLLYPVRCRGAMASCCGYSLSASTFLVCSFPRLPFC